jgi:hypothetical protein
MAQDQVTTLEEIGYIRFLYTRINQTVPCVEVQYTIPTSNVTYVMHTDEPLLGDATAKALLTGSRDGHVSMERALLGINEVALGGSNIRSSTPFHFNTVNYRFPVQPCVTEPLYFFTNSETSGGEIGFVVVGATSGAICNTTITKVDPIAPYCQIPKNLPQCIGNASAF